MDWWVLGLEVVGGMGVEIMEGRYLLGAAGDLG